MEPKPEEKESLFRTIAAYVICLIAFAIMFVGPMLVVCFGYKDILLYFLPKSTQMAAVVESAKEGPPSRIFPKRGGDWKVAYRYQIKGVTYHATDVVPPAIMDPDAKSMIIRFFPPYPKISRINSQVSSTPIQALVIVSAVLIYFIREAIG